VKIADFGLSQFYRPGVPLKCDGSGTISTSAPELFVKNATYKSETYNLGKIERSEGKGKEECLLCASDDIILLPSMSTRLTPLILSLLQDLLWMSGPSV
jgi:serine/threonine protein kinase